LEAEPDCPYAELWIGAHSKASSDVVLDSSRVSLRELISQRPVAILGPAVSERFSQALPFLFKVLSAAEALSIQVHPSKEQAQRLYAQDPDHYPDDNHKPELAIALDSLTALVGFKDLGGLVRTLDEYPEIAGFVGQEVCQELGKSVDPSRSQQRELVRQLYSTLVRRSIAEKETLSETTALLGKRLSETKSPLKAEEEAFLDLIKKYSGADVGLLSIFLLNCIQLQQGQGVFIKAGVPHAYLRGNIVECMANSDNVVRVGLTPKFKDAETLLEILEYEPEPVSILEGPPHADEVIYQTPADEFQVSRWELRPGRERTQTTRNSLRMLLVTRGSVRVCWKEGTQVNEATYRQGQSLLIPALLDEFSVRALGLAELFKVEIPL
jgi:mannose-6-phosphate isomerase